MMTFSLRFGGGIGRSVAVVLFDISRFGFFGVAHLFFYSDFTSQGAERGDDAKESSSLVLSSCWIFTCIQLSSKNGISIEVECIVDSSQEGERVRSPPLTNGCHINRLKEKKTWMVIIFSF